MDNIGVIGGGAIGLLLAGYLTKAGFHVSIYTNTKEQAELLNTNGLTLQIGAEETNFTVKSVPFSEVRELTDDYLFIAVKQYHLEQLTPQLFQKLKTVNSLVFMQNGMGHIKYFNKFLTKVENLFVAIVEHGALKQSQTHVKHTGVGEMKIGGYYLGNSFAKEIWQRITNVGFCTAVYADWLKILEKKLIVNGVINPLTAIYKVNNGILASNPYYLKLMRQVFEEISLVFECEEADWEQIINVCIKTSQNRSSMLKDIEEGRKTEIDAITGVILERGVMKKRQLPLNSFLFNSVKAFEIQKQEESR